MSIIAPAILAENTHQYREQIERVAGFATRVHIDLVDGVFAKGTTPGIGQIWWPHTIIADFHVMYQKPAEVLDDIIELCPSLVVLHSESDGNFVDMAKKLHVKGIKVGVCLLPKTSVESIAPAIEFIDHVLIFSGTLGRFGGKVDLKLLKKVDEIRDLNQHIEIGWDGGVTDENAKALVEGGVDVLNVGGFIQRSVDPKDSFDELKILADR
ncbi:MAG: hypothetical protein M3P98_01175 [bacterium]|nr:hypothetical protein [bacterium]